MWPKSQNILFWLLPHPAGLPNAARRQVSTIRNEQKTALSNVVGARETKEAWTGTNEGPGLRAACSREGGAWDPFFPNLTLPSDRGTTILSSPLSQLHLELHFNFNQKYRFCRGKGKICKLPWPPPPINSMQRENAAKVLCGPLHHLTEISCSARKGTGEQYSRIGKQRHQQECLRVLSPPLEDCEITVCARQTRRERPLSGNSKSWHGHDF